MEELFSALVNCIHNDLNLSFFKDCEIVVLDTWSHAQDSQVFNIFLLLLLFRKFVMSSILQVINHVL